jgi:hypothetical protein
MASAGIVMEIHEPNATLHAYLADFTINDAQLKSTHVDFLAKVFAAISASPGAAGPEGWIVTLWGKTSRTGSAQLNRSLAGRRTAAVRAYLDEKLRSLSNARVRFVEFPWEEEMAGPDDDVETEFHRSVEVWLTKMPFPKPKEKRLPAPKKEWACMRFWLEAKKLNAGAFRFIRGDLVAATSEDASWYGWWFSAKGGGGSLRDPRFVGELRTTPSAPISYDPKLIQLPALLPGKLIRVQVAGYYVRLQIVHVLPREPDADYEPIKGVRDTRDLVFSVEMPQLDAELGAFTSSGDLGPRKTMPIGGRYVDPCTDDPPGYRA